MGSTWDVFHALYLRSQFVTLKPTPHPESTEHEIFREPLNIAAHRLIEDLGFDAVQQCQIGVQHDLLPAYNADPGGNPLDGDDLGSWSGLCLGHRG